jgi:hypothetical protein
MNKHCWKLVGGVFAAVLIASAAVKADWYWQNTEDDNDGSHIRWVKVRVDDYRVLASAEGRHFDTDDLVNECYAETYVIDGGGSDEDDGSCASSGAGADAYVLDFSHYDGDPPWCATVTAYAAWWKVTPSEQEIDFDDLGSPVWTELCIE